MSPKCEIPNCTAEVVLYRQCPEKACGRDFVYCPDHGGDERAMEAVKTHIQITHRTPIQ